MNTLLSDDRVTLRAIEPTDVDLLYRWENDTTLWTVSDTSAPFSRQLLWQYLQNYTADIYESRQVRFVVTLTATGEPVGLLDLMNFDPLNNRAELGLFIDSGHRGQGIGRHALTLIETYAAQHIGMKQLYVKIRTDADDCLHLFTTAGYTTVGTLQAWVKRGNNYHDAVLLQHLLNHKK